MAGLAFLTFAAGCVGQDQARHLPPLPVDPSFARSAARLAEPDRNSFAQAILLYPADREDHHRIPIGSYLFSRMGGVFPKGTEIHHLRLLLWQANCGVIGFFDDRVRCSLIAEVSVEVAGQPLRVSFALPNRILGERVFANEFGSWLGTKEDEVALRRQAILFVEEAVLAFFVELRRKLQEYS